MDVVTQSMLFEEALKKHPDHDIDEIECLGFSSFNNRHMMWYNTKDHSTRMVVIDGRIRIAPASAQKGVRVN